MQTVPAREVGKEEAVKLDAFFAHVDRGVGLPADKVYPQGRIFPYMGYSGKNAEDAASGFSVGGHHYGPLAKQKEKLASAKAAGLPYIYGVGLEGSFHKDPPIRFTEESLRAEIRRQVSEVMGDAAVAWWYLRPEELRMWRRNEKDYLRTAADEIRKTDPHGRPVWMYDPNHRTSEGLIATGEHLDIIGKGCYVNLAGYQDDRVWVRWTMLQETTACAALMKQDGRRRTPIVMPQLSKDPEDPALDAMIPTWVRHDVYLGLICGARGVAIWSLFPRREVKRTHRVFYDAYARAGRELTGKLGLGQVFLFGEDRADLTVRQTSGPQTVELFTGPRNKLEEGTMAEEEKQRHTHRYPALATREITYAGRRYLFLCNSTRETVGCEIGGVPTHGAVVEDLFDDEALQPTDGRLLRELGPWEARAIRVSRGRAETSRASRPE